MEKVMRMLSEMLDQFALGVIKIRSCLRLVAVLAGEDDLFLAGGVVELGDVNGRQR